MNYKILSQTGEVLRPKATRPYVAAWVGRDKDGKAVYGKHFEFTTKAKHPIGSKEIPYPNDKFVVWVYESVIAQEIK